MNDQYVRNKLKVVLFPFLHRVCTNLLISPLLILLSLLSPPYSLISVLLLFQGHWTRITDPIGGRLSYKPPIYDINAPDLYIPFMAFGTYVVLAGFSLGLQGKWVQISFSCTIIIIFFKKMRNHNFITQMKRFTTGQERDIKQKEPKTSNWKGEKIRKRRKKRKKIVQLVRIIGKG